MNVFYLDDIENIGLGIGLPPSEWAGNCHAVVSAIMKKAPVRGARLCRGFYIGPIDRNSIFHGRPFTGHSWIQLGPAYGNRIIDPTAFAFTEPNKPNIKVFKPPGHDRYIDSALQLINKAGTGGMPEAANLNVKMECVPYAHIKFLESYGVEITKGSPRRCDAEQLHWLVRRSYNWDEEVTSNVSSYLYRILDYLGLRALVPIDRWQYIMERHTLMAKPIPGVGFFTVAFD